MSKIHRRVEQVDPASTVFLYTYLNSLRNFFLINESKAPTSWYHLTCVSPKTILYYLKPNRPFVQKNSIAVYSLTHIPFLTSSCPDRLDLLEDPAVVKNPSWFCPPGLQLSSVCGIPVLQNEIWVGWAGNGIPYWKTRPFFHLCERFCAADDSLSDVGQTFSADHCSCKTRGNSVGSCSDWGVPAKNICSKFRDSGRSPREFSDTAVSRYHRPLSSSSNHTR